MSKHVVCLSTRLDPSPSPSLPRQSQFVPTSLVPQVGRRCRSGPCPSSSGRGDVLVRREEAEGSVGHQDELLRRLLLLLLLLLLIVLYLQREGDGDWCDHGFLLLVLEEAGGGDFFHEG